MKKNCEHCYSCSAGFLLRWPTSITAKVCEHHGKSLRTSRQKFVNITAKVTEHRTGNTNTLHLESHESVPNMSFASHAVGPI